MEINIHPIESIIKRFAVKEAYIFGSYLENSKTANDIDIGVIMKDKGDFFNLYAALIMEINFPVDLVLLNDNCLFNTMIINNGLKIYG